MFDRVLDRLAGLIGPGYLNHDAITRAELVESGHLDQPTEAGGWK